MSRFTVDQGGEPTFVLLGDVAVRATADPVRLGGPKQRAVLAVLLLEPGRVVSLDRVIEALWGERPPPRPEVSVRGYVSNLRRALAGVAALGFRDGGYVIEVDRDEIDLHRFERLVERVAHATRDGRAADGRDDASADLAAAMALWRGRPFGSLGDDPPFSTVAVRLDERHAQLEELAFDFRLAGGAAGELVVSLQEAVATHPFRERRRAQLALALYRSDRPVEALRSIEAAREQLRDEVGVDPGPELIRLERAILDHDPTLMWRPAAATTASSERFIGRSAEVGRIRAAADALVDRRPEQGAVVVVSGEAGIGKTALVRAALDGSTRIRVAWAGGAEAALDTAYGVWSTLAGQLTRLGIVADVDVAAGHEPVVTRAAIAESIGSAGEPFALVVDDLQWVDAATLEVLALLAAERPPSMFLVVTVRSPDLDRRAAVDTCLAELSRHSARIDLRGLSTADVETWLAEQGRDRARRVHDRTAGHPFFIRELVALLATGDHPDPSAALLDAVPVAVQDVVRRRVSRLPADGQRLLSAAAILGRRVDLGVLAGVVDEPIADVLDALEPALIAGIIAPDPERVGQMVFSHALVADTLRAELSPVRLARGHAAVARVMERRWHGDLDAVIDELAVHAHAGAAAGTAIEAVRHARRAAELATAANAPSDAAAHLVRALDAMSINAPADRALRQDLLTELGIARAAAGDPMAARTALVAAADLADRRSDAAGVATAMRHVNGDDLWSGLDWSQCDDSTIAVIQRALDRIQPGDMVARAELTAALSTERYAVDAERARIDAAAAIAFAADVDDPLLHFRLLLRKCWAEWRPAGQPVRAAAGDRMVELASAGGLPSRFVPLAHLTRFVAAYEVGDAATADRHLAVAKATADPVRTPAEWTYVRYAEWSLHVARGRFTEARTVTEEVYESMRRSRPAVADATRAGLRIQVAVELGRTEEALAAIDDLASTPYRPSAPWWRAWALARGGCPDEVASNLRQFDGPLPDDWYRAPLLCAALEAAAVIGDSDFIAAHIEVLLPLQHHIAIAGSGGLVLGPIAITVARAAAVVGDVAGARASLARAEVIASAMRSVPWLEQITAIAARL